MYTKTYEWCNGKINRLLCILFSSPNFLISQTQTHFLFSLDGEKFCRLFLNRIFIWISHSFNGSTLTDFTIVRTFLLFITVLRWRYCHCYCCCRRRRRLCRWWWCCSCCLLMVMMVLLLPIQNDANSMACTFKLNQVYRRGPWLSTSTAYTP